MLLKKLVSNCGGRKTNPGSLMLPINIGRQAGQNYDPLSGFPNDGSPITKILSSPVSIRSSTNNCAKVELYCLKLVDFCR